MRCGNSFSPFAAVAALVAVVLIATVSAGKVDETIQWKDCTGPADHPTIGKGNYFNLCVKGHKFRKERYAYTFTKTTITDSQFDDCTFANTPEKKMNLTFATWRNVKFVKTTFASYTQDPVIFDYTLLEDVVFDSCIFDSTSNIIFSNFEFRNVTFINCEFQSNALFELGQMTKAFFNETGFRRSPSAKTVSGSNRIVFSGVTMRNVYFTDDDFVTPAVFEAAAIADMHFNDTNFNEFWCHEIPEKKGKEPEKHAAFNDTLFDNVNFAGNVECDRVTWKGMYMYKVRFGGDAHFSNSDILDLYWNKVTAKSIDKSCHTVDFSSSKIERKVLANTTIDCIADFRKTQFDQVFIKTFDAGRPNFEEATFTDQEYIDGQCCTTACAKLGCKCNVTEPSGECPEGSSKVNLNAAGACFSDDATVTLHTGEVVTMAKLQLADRVSIDSSHHSDVYFFGHRDPVALSEFVRIESTSAANKPLFISPGHYLYVNGRLATASTVGVGDKLRDPKGKDTLQVVSVSREMRRGLYAPTTLHGDLVVDGVVVSCYTNVLHPSTAHRLLKPLRVMYGSPLRAVVPSFSSIMRSGSWDWLARRMGLSTGPDSLVDQL